MERLHIAFFGAVNSGKSTLVNAIAGQQVSLVSPVPGTTTDPVRKAIELPLGIGPAVLIDTAGLDDSSILGAERRRRTLSILDQTDIAVIVRRETAADVPDIGTLAAQAGIPVICYTRGETVESLLARIAAARPAEVNPYLTGNLVQEGDTVLLVMPQDSEAPKGRIILPQVQVLRELLDRRCNALCCTPESLAGASASLRERPALVITDSQVFGLVDRSIPKDWPLTSFSILLASAKGDIRTFKEGAQAIGRLNSRSRVLIAEACTHVPDTEDIGRVKIPNLLRKRVAAGCGTSGDSLLAGPRIDIAAGNDFPEDLSPYDLIIHCGACVANRQTVRARTRKARLAGVPITNYGIALAYLQGILERVVIPGPASRKEG
ncbi:MAG: 50S ribosome-binding GTPase [Bacteroidales bacterium]|nr:50S ribosome-binding GTPase [Bacteroidales bacterium]